MGPGRAAALGVAGAALLVTAACAPVREPEPAAPGAADARIALTAAVDRITDDTGTITQETATVHSVTRIDPRTKNADLTVRANVPSGSGTEEIRAEIRALGDVGYLQLIGLDGIDARRWIKVERDKLAGTVFSVDAEEQFEALGGQFATVRGGPRTYDGTVWIREHVDGFMTHLGGAPATTVPFAATTDPDGRLTSLVVDPSSLGMGQSRIRQTFSGFGDPVTVVAPPPALTVVGTDEMLAALGIG